MLSDWPSHSIVYTAETSRVTMELGYDYLMPTEDENVSYIMLHRRSGFCNAGREPTRRYPLVDPLTKPSIIANTDDDLWLTPMQRYVELRQLIQSRRSLLVAALLYTYLWIGIAGLSLISVDVSSLQFLTMTLGWYLAVYTAYNRMLQNFGHKLNLAEEALIQELQPKFANVGCQIDYHYVHPKFFCGVLESYSYSYMKIEKKVPA